MGQLVRYKKKRGETDIHHHHCMVAFDKFEDLDKIKCDITSSVH
jgi:hypothetical protein